MKEIFAFIQKEFRHIFRDRRTTLIVLVMPIVQIILFGFAISTEVHNAVVDVVGDPGDPVVRNIIDRIDNNKYLSIGEFHNSPSEAEVRIRKGKAKAFLCFESDFDKKFSSQGKAVIQIVSDGELRTDCDELHQRRAAEQPGGIFREDVRNREHMHEA